MIGLWLALLLGSVFAAGIAGSAAAKPVQFERLSASPVAHGERLAIVLGCTGCHGNDLTGNDWSEPGWAVAWTSNLTRAVPRYTDAALARAIRAGVRADGSAMWDMPSHLFTRLQPGEMAAIIAFLRSRPPTGLDHPRAVFEATAKAEMVAGRYRSSPANVAYFAKTLTPDIGPAHALGRHIVIATCAECHGLDLRGGEAPPGQQPPPDLRILAGYDAGQFETLLTAGTPIGGRDIGLMGQVARNRYKALTVAERAAVHAYLQQVAKLVP